jgi:hypothetical protein
MKYRLTEIDILRFKGFFGLMTMLAIGVKFEEWYYYSPDTKPMHQTTFEQFIDRQKKFAELYKEKAKMER